jgi:hypothetical protein
MNDDQQEMIDAQEASQVSSRSAATAQQLAMDQKKRTIHNEDFLNELRKVTFDSDTHNWVSEEYPEIFSGIHAVSNRGDHWAKEADLRMANKRERAIAEGRPGRLLRTRPFMHAAMTGKESPQLDAYDEPGIPGGPDYWREHVIAAETTQAPVTSEEARLIAGATDAAADLMALSRNAAGLDAVSTVKTDSTVRKQSEDETTASRVGRLLE